MNKFIFEIIPFAYIKLDKVPTQKKKIRQHQIQLKAKWKNQIESTKNWTIAALIESKMNKGIFE